MKTSDLDYPGQVAAWNSLYPVGTAVLIDRGLHRNPESGVTVTPAALRGGGYSRPVVWISGQSSPVPITSLTVVRDRVDPCDVCGHPKENHRIRYAALQGHHEWTDPLARAVAYVADPDRTATGLAAPSSHGDNACPRCSGPVRETVGMVCPSCGTNYAPTASKAIAAAPEPVIPIDPERPGLLARIFHAPNKKESTTR